MFRVFMYPKRRRENAHPPPEVFFHVNCAAAVAGPAMSDGQDIHEALRLAEEHYAFGRVEEAFDIVSETVERDTSGCSHYRLGTLIPK